jgi:iron complex outermembrane receptor protein
LLFSVITDVGYWLNAQSISGNVTDSSTHKPLVGASVYITQLKAGAITDSKGNYKIARVAKGTYHVGLEMVGYGPVDSLVTVDGNVTLNFATAVVSETLKDAVITSLGNATSLRRAPVPVSVVSHAAFLQQASTNVIDAIATQPGVAP